MFSSHASTPTVSTVPRVTFEKSSVPVPDDDDLPPPGTLRPVFRDVRMRLYDSEMSSSSSSHTSPDHWHGRTGHAVVDDRVCDYVETAVRAHGLVHPRRTVRPPEHARAIITTIQSRTCKRRGRPMIIIHTSFQNIRRHENQRVCICVRLHTERMWKKNKTIINVFASLCT